MTRRSGPEPVARPSAIGAARRLRLRGRVDSLRRQGGQATVELVALLPLLLVTALAGALVLAAQTAQEQAGQAAQAGAMALIQDGDPRAAARKALPTGARDRAHIVIRGRRVSVRVRPDVPLPPLTAPLTGEATADAGPEPSP